MHIGCIEYTTPAVLCQGNFSGTLSRPFYRLAVCLSNYVCWVLLLFIRKRRFALVVYFFFFNEEYLIVPVDFIVALRRTRGQRRWTLRESLSSILWTLTPHPGVIRWGGALWLPRFIPIQIACIRCCRYSPVPNFVQLSVFGSVSLAFQSGCWAVVVRFSLLGGWTVRTCGYVGLGYGLSLELPLTANGSAIWRMKGSGSL